MIQKGNQPQEGAGGAPFTYSLRNTLKPLTGVVGLLHRASVVTHPTPQHASFTLIPLVHTHPPSRMHLPPVSMLKTPSDRTFTPAHPTSIESAQIDLPSAIQRGPEVVEKAHLSDLGILLILPQAASPAPFEGHPTPDWLGCRSPCCLPIPGSRCM